MDPLYIPGNILVTQSPYNKRTIHLYDETDWSEVGLFHSNEIGVVLGSHWDSAKFVRVMTSSGVIGVIHPTCVKVIP